MAVERRFGRWAWIVAGLVALSGTAYAQQVPAVNRAVDYLRANIRSGAGYSSNTGENALAALAMIKAEVPPTDPALATAIRSIEARFSGSTYNPERQGGADVYEASVVIMALANLDPSARKAQISSAAEYLMGKQKGNGSWDYSHRSAGDASISQYAVLGLWEAENAGVPVSPRVWDNAAAWYISSQSPSGSWTYHRDEPQYTDSLSMTAAGVGSLLICQRQLAAYKQLVASQNPYLVPLLTEAQRTRYKVETPPARIAGAIRSGLDWITKNFTTTNSGIIGQSPYYCLYGIERVGALAGRENLGRVDWYDQGSRFLNSSQMAGGAWTSMHGDVPNTAWGVLFLTKATAKSVERITLRRLGAGELFGGKGLPRDLSSITEAGGRLIARPMDGAIEGMLTVLEDPRSDNADSALAGLLARYQESGPAAIAPYKDRFRKLLTDPDPGIRRVAAWALARTADLAMVSVLADALRDPDEVVVREADRGLRLLSRKIAGFGPPDHSTPAQRAEASKAWKAWYESVRPLRVDPSSGPTGPGRKGP